MACRTSKPLGPTSDELFPYPEKYFSVSRLFHELQAGNGFYSLVRFSVETLLPLLNDRAYCDYLLASASHHPNGWDRIVLFPARNRSDFEVRLHFHDPATSNCLIHNHAWDFYTGIFCGELVHTAVGIIEGDSYKLYQSQSQRKFGDGKIRHNLALTGTCSFLPLLQHTVSAGQMLFLHHDVFHTVRPRCVGTISLVLQLPFSSNTSAVAVPINEDFQLQPVSNYLLESDVFGHLDSFKSSISALSV